MEPVGLAVGIVGLAGLFSSCLEVVEKVSAYKSFEKDSSRLGSQFKATKLRLKHWGEAVGLSTDGTLASKHHAALDDPDTCEMVKELLKCIADASMANAGHGATLNGPVQTQKGRGVLSTSLLHRPMDAKPLSKTRSNRIGWALTGRSNRIEEVDVLQELVQHLHDLVPPDMDRGNDNTDRLTPSSLIDLLKGYIRDKCKTYNTLTSLCNSNVGSHSKKRTCTLAQRRLRTKRSL